jgi:hypothetical protein
LITLPKTITGNGEIGYTNSFGKYRENNKITQVNMRLN